MSKKITNAIQKVNKDALELAILAVREDNQEVIEMLGLADVDNESLNALSRLDVHQLSFAEDFRGQLVDVRLHSRGLGLYLDMAVRKQREQDTENRAIRAGMRQFMLNKLTGMSRREYESRLKLLDLPSHERGRIELLDDDQEAKVFSVWKRLLNEKTSSELERYCRLHDETGIELDRAYQSIDQLQSYDRKATGSSAS
ncbi:hypothetical protein AB835_08015 [Candidatus Endobugula sertula]|uniref:DUF2857 domain-containing protein n=1 Tax=Candidatus Endobugula sertula TaxID=62101 RepID=A0A1D2QPN2_9GAMM|nr:hypothetical protein AB835_08015 [Candidatus Endobugula sertula]